MCELANISEMDENMHEHIRERASGWRAYKFRDTHYVERSYGGLLAF